MEDDGGTGRWLTYDELAVVRGIKRSGAVRLVQRLKWRRQAGNDGRARILVPHDELGVVSGTRPHTDRPRRGGDDGGDTISGDALSVHTRVLVALEAAVTGLTQRAEQAEARAEAANQRADSALAVADRTLAQLSEATARIAEADRRAERLEQDLAAALSAADHVRAEAGAAQEQTDALRDQLAGAKRDLAVAQHDAQAAQEAAAELRLAEETRKARGRLRRAWDGWRGR